MAGEARKAALWLVANSVSMTVCMYLYETAGGTFNAFAVSVNFAACLYHMNTLVRAAAIRSIAQQDWSDDAGNDFESVTHWQALPEPPVQNQSQT